MTSATSKGSGTAANARDGSNLTVLMIGCNQSVLQLLSQDESIRVLMIEERPIYDRHPEKYRVVGVNDLRFAAYQASNAAEGAAAAWAQEQQLDAVIAGTELSVAAANRIAFKFGLPCPGDSAVSACTSKLALRSTCAASSILQPQYAAVTTVREVGDFFAARRGSPIVLKPLNRSGSAGVTRITNQCEILEAWREASVAKEPSRLPAGGQSEFIAEAFIPGYEVSAESLVQDGKSLFCNVTLKDTTQGRYFAEIGHITPAPISINDRLSVESAQLELLRALHAYAGIFHSEWKVTPDGPYLIECAARPPGDHIPTLISRAWGFNMGVALAQILSGSEFVAPKEPKSWAAARFFVPPSGRILTIRGAEVLARHPNIFDYRISVEPGTIVGSVRDTWSRGGHYLVQASTVPELRAVIEEVEGAVHFDVTPS